MTNTELKELIEDCCNEIANKIEPLANVNKKLIYSLPKFWCKIMSGTNDTNIESLGYVYYS